MVDDTASCLDVVVFKLQDRKKDSSEEFAKPDNHLIVLSMSSYSYTCEEKVERSVALLCR